MIDGNKLAEAGFRYLGTPYSAMDCQAFAERCLRDCGLHMDLAGSNAWYREVMNHGWTGTPEECAKRFGKVPAGAFLFILAYDGREPEKYRKDGIGNASHIGIATGRGEGAIHSSSSRGCVAESRFAGKTVPGGGWNRVGLWLERIAYEGIRNGGEAPAPDAAAGGPPGNGAPAGCPEGERKMTVTVWSENGKPVNLRKQPDRNAALLDRFPVGTEAELLESGPEWCRIRIKGKTGWMMARFLAADGCAGQGGTENPGILYTVCIPHRTEAEADALLRAYAGAVRSEEKG